MMQIAPPFSESIGVGTEWALSQYRANTPSGMVTRAATSPFFLIKLVHGGGQLALAASQGVLMLFSLLLPLCPASGWLT